MLRPELFKSLAMISPTGFGGGTLSRSERRRKALGARFWGQAFFDLLASRPSIGHYLRKSFAGRPPRELVEHAIDTAHQPGARFASLYFLGGQLFTPEARDQLYAWLQLPVLVLFDLDRYVNFERLDEFADERPNWSVPETWGMPQWEKTAMTGDQLNQFWT